MRTPQYFSPLPTPAEMQLWDKETQKLGLPSLVLMENAAHATFDFLLRLNPELTKKTCGVLVGSGNNGGDAVALARYLCEAEIPVCLYCVPSVFNGTKQSGELAIQMKLADALGIPKKPLEAILEDSPHTVIDGLLGIGLTNPVRSDLAKSITLLAQKKFPFVVALDVPSGLDANTGLPNPVALPATLTICMEAIKIGLCQPSALPYVGKRSYVPIGIPNKIKTQFPAKNYLLHKSLATPSLNMPRNSHKIQFGSVAVIGAGTSEHAGACHLAARAALRSGAGLVYCIAPQKVLNDIRCGLPELMLISHGFEQWEEHFSQEIRARLCSMQALVIGPGFGLDTCAQNSFAEFLKIPNRPPCVFDADALTLFAKNPSLLSSVRPIDILTPHPGEAARLLKTNAKEIQSNRMDALSKLCALQGGAVILKGAATLISQKNEPVFVSPSDIPQLAIAGAGDVLAGLLAGLIAQKKALSFPTLVENQQSNINIAALAVSMHVQSATLLAKENPYRGFLAQELADMLPKLQQLSRAK